MGDVLCVMNAKKGRFFDIATIMRINTALNPCQKVVMRLRMHKILQLSFSQNTKLQLTSQNGGLTWVTLHPPHFCLTRELSLISPSIYIFVALLTWKSAVEISFCLTVWVFVIQSVSYKTPSFHFNTSYCLVQTFKAKKGHNKQVLWKFRSLTSDQRHSFRWLRVWLNHNQSGNNMYNWFSQSQKKRIINILKLRVHKSASKIHARDSEDTRDVERARILWANSLKTLHYHPSPLPTFARP